MRWNQTIIEIINGRMGKNIIFLKKNTKNGCGEGHWRGHSLCSTSHSLKLSKEPRQQSRAGDLAENTGLTRQLFSCPSCWAHLAEYFTLLQTSNPFYWRGNGAAGHCDWITYFNLMTHRMVCLVFFFLLLFLEDQLCGKHLFIWHQFKCNLILVLLTDLIPCLSSTSCWLEAPLSWTRSYVICTTDIS